MVIDTSAVIAVLLEEDDTFRIERAIAADQVRLMSTASVLEASIVMTRIYGENGRRELDLFLSVSSVESIPFNEEQLRIARVAFETYGKTRHQARLNYGDCFSYALSKATGEPLLFKGEDFARTDIMPAVLEK